LSSLHAAEPGYDFGGIADTMHGFGADLAEADGGAGDLYAHGMAKREVSG
jgi:hypothetical protein